MKTNLVPRDLERTVEGTMRWDDGTEVYVILDWDRNHFYVWFEISDSSEEFYERVGLHDKLAEITDEINSTGVHSFYDLDSVNQYVESMCGDDEPVVFLRDELYPNIIYAGYDY